MAESILHSIIEGHFAGYERITPAELPSYIGNAGYQLLTLSEPHHEHAIFIRVDELGVRARYELNPAVPVVVECGRVPAFACQFAANALTQLRFRKVIVAGLPSRPAGCR
jgi:hypothetical protein